MVLGSRELILEVGTADQNLVSGLLVPRPRLVPSDRGAVGILAQAPSLAKTLEPARLSKSVRLSESIRLSGSVCLSESVRRQDLRCVVSV